jgi:hypothetical protein
MEEAKAPGSLDKDLSVCDKLRATGDVDEITFDCGAVVSFDDRLS